MNDTIAAISTTLGVGAISIIRVSGPDSIKIVNSITKSKKIIDAATHTINYDYIVNDDKKVDEVLISVMLAPRTFTCEDVVEINAHGGIATTNEILKLLLKNGCRLAEPGEFTKRAFLNGRIDLTQAEAVSDLINSKTDKSRDLAVKQLSGEVSNMIRSLRQELLEILANIEVNIDYPEYEDIEEITTQILAPKVISLENKMKKILSNSKDTLMMKDGIKTSIIGKPNVGKSSILNRLLNEEKAIVTDIAGTTRDIVEGKISLDGLILNIFDTAGIRNTNNIVEKIGVNKSLTLIEESDLVLFVLNNNEELSKKEAEILEKLTDKNYIIIVNKIDLETKLKLDSKYKDKIIEISALSNTGIEDLKNKIKAMFNLESFELEDVSYLTNARSLALLEKALETIVEVKNSLDSLMPVDVIAIDIKFIWDILGEIIGETYQEELIKQLFSQFCLGK